MCPGEVVLCLSRLVTGLINFSPLRLLTIHTQPYTLISFDTFKKSCD
jgi:hypothetical protein